MNKTDVLEKEIQKHDKLYWEKGEPIISDIEYDKLIEDLKNIDPGNSLINKINTPKVSSKIKIKHKHEMLSLNKVYSKEELIKWCEKIVRNEDEKFLIQLKYDGCSAELNNGILSTRGDGVVGEDITNKLPIIEIISEKEHSGYIRGEILIVKSTFQNIKNINPKQIYKTERNMCAGVLNRDDIDLSHGKILTLIDFNQNSRILSLKEIKEIVWDQLIKTCQNSEYPADGIVFKIQDQIYAKSLGITSHHLKSEMALKFENPTGETRLIGIEWSSGKHKLTPIGKVIPVEINGVIISNINLHNYKYILDNDICIGDTIIVERAGDVIPDVQSSFPTKGKPRQFINLNFCPVCQMIVKYIEPEIVCTNDNCSGKHLAQLMDSVRRIGIERLGEPTLKKMIKTLNIKNLIDIFGLSKDDIIKLEGFKEKSTKNLYDEIYSIKQNGVYEWQILSSLNLHGIGKTLSKELLKNRTLNELMKINSFDFLKIEGIGPERSLVLFNGLIENSNYINNLINILPIKREDNMNNNIKDLAFALTGAMPLKRNEIVKKIESQGGKVKGISKDINFVVSSDPNTNSGKIQKAREYGIPIISFDELMEKLN